MIKVLAEQTSDYRLVARPQPCDPHDRSAEVGPPDLIRTFEAATATGALHLVYQPKLSLQSGRIAGIEALIRWQHPVLGAISPVAIVAHFERANRIRDLTLWVLSQALADRRLLPGQGEGVRVYINISSLLPTDAEFAAHITEMAPQRTNAIGFDICGIPTLDDPDSAMRNLRHFVALGIEIAIDDHGQCEASRRFLRAFPASELKIDRAFIRELADSRRDPGVSRSTIDLAHALGMKVVAEGVESPAELALLRAMGCDLVQGFLLSRPLPIGDLQRFLADGHYRALFATEAAATRTPRHAIVPPTNAHSVLALAE